MPLPRKRRLSTHNELPLFSHPDKLPPNGSHRSPSSLFAPHNVQLALVNAPSHRETALPLPTSDKIHISVLSMVQCPPFLSPRLSTPCRQLSISPSAPQHPPTAFSASTVSEPLCQPAPSTPLTKDSRLGVFQEENTDLPKAVSSHRTAFSISKNSLEEVTIARRGTVSAFGALQKQFQPLKVELTFPKKQPQAHAEKSSHPSQHLRQKSRPAFRN